tara:strand:- start:1593 stop:1910 length:318 start_codon:yes stop_codon:yes gene_type:complete
MKILKFFLILTLYILVSSCGTVKEAFTNQKKNSSDEFLVEKKSPLVMPPDYNDLPVPNTQNNVDENSNNIESLITNNEKGDAKYNNSDGKDQNLEETLLKKIKKN